MGGGERPLTSLLIYAGGARLLQACPPIYGGPEPSSITGIENPNAICSGARLKRTNEEFSGPTERPLTLQTPSHIPLPTPCPRLFPCIGLSSAAFRVLFINVIGWDQNDFVMKRTRRWPQGKSQGTRTSSEHQEPSGAGASSEKASPHTLLTSPPFLLSFPLGIFSACLNIKSLPLSTALGFQAHEVPWRPQDKDTNGTALV